MNSPACDQVLLKLRPAQNQEKSPAHEKKNSQRVEHAWLRCPRWRLARCFGNWCAAPGLVVAAAAAAAMAAAFDDPELRRQEMDQSSCFKGRFKNEERKTQRVAALRAAAPQRGASF